MLEISDARAVGGVVRFERLVNGKKAATTNGVGHQVAEVAVRQNLFEATHRAPASSLCWPRPLRRLHAASPPSGRQTQATHRSSEMHFLAHSACDKDARANGGPAHDLSETVPLPVPTYLSSTLNRLTPAVCDGPSRRAPLTWLYSQQSVVLDALENCQLSQRSSRVHLSAHSSQPSTE